MNILRKRLEQDLKDGRERILCCGASALGGWFVSYHRRGNIRNISCTSYGKVTKQDVAYCTEHGITFFDFRIDETFRDLCKQHSALLEQYSY